MAELAHEGTAYEVVEEEPPEVLARNLTSAGYLLASATSFFFLAFVFAYFYLRSLNSNALWKPKGVDPSVAWGTIVVACYVVSAIVLRLGLMDHRANRRAPGGSRASSLCSPDLQGSCSRSWPGRSRASARRTAATRASTSAGRASSSCSS